MIAEVPFSELLSVVIDNRGKTCPTADAGIPLIATNCIRNELLYPTYDKVRFVSKETYSNWFRGHPLPGDIIFVNKATPGRVCLVPDPVDFCIAQDMVAVRANPKRVYPNYLFAVLRSPAVQEKIGQMHVGTLIPHFKKGDFDKLLLPIPEPKAQEFIGDTYFELSAKIDANRRMNATLEAMARALFQSWFVDFDPVRAKLDGRPPAALAPATAALFPDSFQDSPLGHIPTGWETSTIGAKLQTALGGTPSRAKPEFWTDGTVAWINSGKTNEFRIIEPSEWITKEALENSATKLLPRRTTVLAITGATLGQVSITEIECCANQSVVAILASEQFPTEFIYPWIEENIEKLIASQTGGAQQHINKGNVEELALLCPESRIVAAYQTKAKPLFDQISANCFQSRTLATLRDTLLPKLLSGELSVMDEGRQIERATLWKPQLAPPTS